MKVELLILKLSLYLLLFHFSTSKIYPDSWDEFTKDFIETEPKDTFKLHCKDGKCSPNYDFFDIIRRNQKVVSTGIKKYKKAPSSYLPTCSCGLEQGIMDLGSHYYPRYLLTALCKGESCWMGPYKCKPTPYKVKVLKKKISEDESSNSSLPASLKEEWISEIVTVTVACECSH
ncbi:uncharacterized protein [Onthophagus taurus]|uniref:uncharacterized protein n=1 Tax=Onthophagus taurus TaxID=166361 RepID=UPI000C209181|nr:uncharacterized protein LOC111415235 [Onthophagus taurus]